MRILEKNFKVEPVPQGNRTVRFRWELERGEQISKVAVPFVYVRKDYWRIELLHATTVQLQIDPLPENQQQIGNPNKYVWSGGKNSFRFVHFDVFDLPQREMIAIHPIPLVYIQAMWWQDHGAEPFAIIELIPVLPE